MRLTSDFWISAVIRQVQGANGFAYLARRGASEAGAIFIKSRSRFGSIDLFGPAPQTAYDDSKPDERVFTRLLCQVDDAACEARLLKEQRFDADLWILELEDVAEISDFITLASDGEA